MPCRPHGGGGGDRASSQPAALTATPLCSPFPRVRRFPPGRAAAAGLCLLPFPAVSFILPTVFRLLSKSCSGRYQARPREVEEQRMGFPSCCCGNRWKGSSKTGAGRERWAACGGRAVLTSRGEAAWGRESEGGCGGERAAPSGLRAR